MAVQTPALPSAPQALALGLKYGPNAGMALQRSQYLADALRNLQESGTDNLRTPLNLGLHLLAQGLTAYAKNKADKQAMSAYAADQADQDKRLFAGTPLDPSAQPPPAAAPAAPEIATPAPEAQAPSPQPAALPPQADAGASATPDQVKLAQMVWGEARGESPEGQQAVASVALNRARTGNKALAEVLAAPHQFEGYNARAQAIGPDQLAPILANIQPALAGHDRTGGATNFLNPDLQAQLGRPQPSWAPAGQGERIGHHVFYGGNPQMAAQDAPPPPPPPAENGPPILAGADPFPPPPQAQAPQSAPQALSSPGPALAAPAAVVAPPAAGAMPHQTVTPEEWQLAASLLHDPRTREAGVQEILKLKMRAAAPVEMKPGTYWGPDGKPHSVEQFQDQPGSPNAYVQRSSLDNHVTATANPAYGAVPGGMVMGAGGAISQVPTAQRNTYRIPGAPGLYVNDEKGNPQKVADDQYGPTELLRMRENLLSSEPVKNYQQSADAYGAMVNAAKQGLGGMRAYALRDTFARAINPGAVARAGTIEAIKQSQGLPANIKAFFMNLQGDGNVPPEIAQQILDITHGFVASHYHGAQLLVDSNAEYAKRHGIDPSDVVVPLGAAPQPFVVPHTPAAAPAAPASGPAPYGLPRPPTPQELQAEIDRRKAGARK